MDADFAKRQLFETRPGPKQSVCLAGGQVQDASTRTTARIRMDAYEEQGREMHVTNLENYDAILGKPWLTDNNPQVMTN